MLKGIIQKILNKYKELFPQYPRKSFGRIGIHCKIGEDSALVPQNIFMDDYSIIQDRNNFISYEGKLFLGKFSVISSGCIIIPANHVPIVGVPFYLATMTHLGDDSHDIVIAEDVWVGAGCILLPKCRIGRGAIIGAGSVVTREIPPYAVAVGNPARVVGCKFTREKVIEHEKKIYCEEERMSFEEIDSLFLNELNNLPVIKNAELDSIQQQDLRQSWHNLEIEK